MNNSESALVICSFIFAVIIYVTMLVRGPRLGLINKDVRFYRPGLKKYAIFLTATAIVSLLLGYLISKDINVALGFAGLNTFIGAAMGFSVFLYRRI